MKSILRLVAFSFSCVLSLATSVFAADRFLEMPPPPPPTNLLTGNLIFQWSNPRMEKPEGSTEGTILDANTREAIMFALNTNGYSNLQVFGSLPSNCVTIAVAAESNSAQASSTVRLAQSYEETPAFGMWRLDLADGRILKGFFSTNGLYRRGELNIDCYLEPPPCWTNGLDESAFLIPKRNWIGFPSNSSGRVTLQWEKYFPADPYYLREHFVHNARMGDITNGVPTGIWQAADRTIFYYSTNSTSHSLMESWYDSNMNCAYYAAWFYDNKYAQRPRYLTPRIIYNDVRAGIQFEWFADRLSSVVLCEPGLWDSPTWIALRPTLTNNDVTAHLSYAGYESRFVLALQPGEESSTRRDDVWKWLIDWRKNGGPFDSATVSRNRRDIPATKRSGN